MKQCLIFYEKNTQKNPPPPKKKKKKYSRTANKFYFFSAALIKSSSKLEKYIWAEANGPLVALQREWGTSVQPFKQPTATRKKYSSRKLAANYNKYNFSQYVSPWPRGKWQWRHFVRGAFEKLENQERFFFSTRTLNFRANIWILSRYAVSLSLEKCCIQWFVFIM
jgi:hypothetical protein